ncbi:MAG: tetratricopeptide repeat protein, partial [Bacteroidia bacterium]|nr:tetratricopeptide repeat protein [Bacteroidia bacterium]
MKSFSGFVFTFLVFLLSFHNSYSQNQGKIDSLKVILRQSDLPETTYIKILNDLTWQLRDIDHEAALKYQSEAATKSFQLSDSLNYARSIYNLAYLKYSKGQLKEAIGLYKKSIDLYDEVRRNDSKVEPMVGLGIIEFNQGNYLTSLNYYLNAYETLHKYSNRNRLAINEMSIAYNIGNIYYITGKYRKALEYYNDCLDRSFKEKNDEFTAAALTGLSNVYYDQKDFDRSIEASLNTISIYKKQGNQKNLAVAYNNIGEVYKIKQNLSKALEYYEKSLKIKKDGGNKFGIATTLLSIGEVYIHSKQVGLALEYINRSLQLARKNNFKLHLKMCYLNLVHVYKLIGDYESVYKNQILYSEIKDSIFNEANTRSMNEMQAKYESDKKEKEIEILTKDNELQGLQSQQQEGQIKKQWYLILGIGSILGLLISLIYVVYSQLKFKKQANKELEQTNDQLEHINKDLGKKNKSIAESINYAQRIQETIMPTQK